MCTSFVLDKKEKLYKKLHIEKQVASFLKMKLEEYKVAIIRGEVEKSSLVDYTWVGEKFLYSFLYRVQVIDISLSALTE